MIMSWSLKGWKEDVNKSWSEKVKSEQGGKMNEFKPGQRVEQCWWQGQLQQWLFFRRELLLVECWIIFCMISDFDGGRVGLTSARFCSMSVKAATWCKNVKARLTSCRCASRREGTFHVGKLDTRSARRYRR